MTTRPTQPVVPSVADLGLDVMAQNLATLQRKVRDLERAGRLGSASMEDATLDVYDDNETLQVGLGRKRKGKWGAGYVGHDAPPRPSLPDVLPIPGALIVFWDGTLEEATDIPLDRVAVYSSDRSGFKLGATAEADDEDIVEVGAIYSEEGGACVIPTWGEDVTYIRLAAISENDVRGPATQQIEGSSAEANIDFYVDEFLLPEDGAQDLVLTFEPIAFSEHVYWHPGGEGNAGIHMQDNVTWTRDEQVLSLTGLPVEAKTGDLVVVKYAYLVGQPTGSRVVVQIVSSDHSDVWTVKLRWVDDNGDQQEVTVNHVNDDGPWDPQEVAFVQLSDLTLRFAGDGFTVDYPNVGHISRVAIDGTDDEGEYVGHRYTLTDQEWNDLGDPVELVAGLDGMTTAEDIPFNGYFTNYGAAYSVARPNGMPIEPYTYQRGESWVVAWSHAKKVTSGAQYYNIPYYKSDLPYGGGIENGPLVFPSGYAGGAAPVLPAGRVVEEAGCYADGFNNATNGLTATVSVDAWRIDIPAILADLGPSAGYPDPEPPAGKALEWESDVASLTRVDVCLAEPVGEAGSNTGSVHLGLYLPGLSGFGPNPLDNTQWKNQSGFDNEVLTTYDGGAGVWNDVTDKVNLEGETWTTVVPACVATGGDGPSTDDPGSPVTRDRIGVGPMWRLHVTPSRYRFVPVEADQSLVLDVKSYVDPDEEA